LFDGILFNLAILVNVKTDYTLALWRYRVTHRYVKTYSNLDVNFLNVSYR